jgi:uncharacterized membrane protein
MPPGYTSSVASGINNVGQAVGYSTVLGGGISFGAVGSTQWSDGSATNLGVLPGFTFSFASGVNDAGQVVGFSEFILPTAIPEPSTWVMMLAGFVGLGLCRLSSRKGGHAILVSGGRGSA